MKTNHSSNLLRGRGARALAAGARSRRRAAGKRRWRTIEPGEWTGPRLADGQPDIQGHWSNTIANHDNFTDPQGGIPGDVARAGGGGARAIGTVRAPNGARAEPRERSARRPSAVPAVGAREAAGACSRTSSIRPREEYIEPLARCAPAGPTKSLTWHGYEIRQYPGYVCSCSTPGTRIIHLDGKPHLPDTIKLWNARLARPLGRQHARRRRDATTTRKARLARTGEFASEQRRTSRSATSSRTTASATSTTRPTRTRRCTRGRGP